uniref:Carboxypeptidase n=1 Tax=Euplotes crassus TaxID=5936 RepID=A0A7S3KD17_EUPCR|mmetsp:Transcript_21487/g.21128  ORF Transcript_21487/g.21128 Transcript_21487/m.21128 type:complete len:617 (+) Transcript_21487:88-1938(+)
MEDSVEELKNFNSSYKFPCSYSGFVNVDEATDSNLFYWFFRDNHFSPDAPLVLWINGGPGSSSAYGNLIENGPFKLVDGPSDSVHVHSVTEQAWTEEANMLYLDQPVGVGYSYGHMPIVNMSQIQEHALNFILGFYQKHPEMQGRDFFITGESYGGKYEPAIAVAIIDYNEQAAKADQIPLKGVLVGNGYTDPITFRMSIRNMATAMGHFQFDTLPDWDAMERKCHAANARQDPEAGEFCGDLAGFATTMDGGMDAFDARYLASNASEGKRRVTTYLNDPQVIRQLHVDVSTKDDKFALSNGTVYENFKPDAMIKYIDEHQKILDNNITLLLFVGQFDRKDGPIPVQEWIKKLNWDGMEDYNAGSRNLYYYQSDDNGEVRLGGNFKQHKNFGVFIMYAAGHMVPATQLALSRSMLSDIIYHGKLQCHHKYGQCSLDKTTCEFMDYCSGHGECVTGKCKCNEGFFGADCSIEPTKLASQTLQLKPTEWAYHSLNGTNGKIKIENSEGNRFTVYSRKGDIPSQSFFDSHFEGSVIEVEVGEGLSGEFLAIFNPDFDNNITLSVNIAQRSTASSTTFWSILALGLLAALLYSSLRLFNNVKVSKKQYEFHASSSTPLHT